MVGFAAHIIQTICPSTHRIAAADALNFSGVTDRVARLVPVLSSVRNELKGGTLNSIVNQAQAEAFDDFQDLGELYLRKDKIPPAGVVTSAVFGDTVKRIASKHDIVLKKQTSKGKTIAMTTDELINALQAKRVLSSPKAKAVNQAPGLRNAALHAGWNDFDTEDVKAAPTFTNSWVQTELDS